MELYYLTNFLTFTIGDETLGPASINIDNDQEPWQFLDSGIAQGGSPSGQFLVRSRNGGNSNCMQVKSGALVLGDCSSSSTSTLWAVADNDFSNNQEAWIISNSNGQYIEGQDDDSPPGLVEDGMTNDPSLMWGLLSLSEINDQSWSTVILSPDETFALIWYKSNR